MSAYSRSGHFGSAAGRCRGRFVFFAIGFGFFGADHTVIGIGGGMAASFTRRLRGFVTNSIASRITPSGAYRQAAAQAAVRHAVKA